MKKIKLLVILILCLNFTACKKNEGLELTNPDAQADQMGQSDGEEGGISAGGGGTLPANPISVFEVYDNIQYVKQVLRLYFNFVRKYSDKPITASEKLYFGIDNLSTQLEKTDIEILSERPCKNKFGKNVDASIYASKPNTICISAFRIAPKLIKETALKEISALIIHELSHFLGANEEEATMLQKFAANRLTGINEDNLAGIENELWGISENLSSLSRDSLKIKELIASKDLKSLSEIIYSFKTELREVDDYFYKKQIPFSFMDYAIRDYLEFIDAKIHLAYIYILSENQSADLSSDVVERYEKCFAGAEYITVSEANERCQLYFAPDSKYIDMQINKINSLNEINEYLKDVFLFSYDLGNQIRSIGFNMPQIYYHLPNSENNLIHWEKYFGDYDLVKQSCTSTFAKNYNPYANLTNITIQTGVSNYPFENEKAITLVEKNDNVFSTHLLIDGGGRRSTMRLYGSNVSAVVTEDSGNRWYHDRHQDWYRITKKITTEGNDLFFDLKNEQYSYSYKGLYQGEASCRFKLIRK